LNSFLGRVLANNTFVSAEEFGEHVFVYATDPTHVILDVNGYFE
jgi:hypothetical protein